MAEVTQLLRAAAEGDPQAAGELLPLVYAELRRLAAARMAGEKQGQTLQATALVHEAYVRLVGGDAARQWAGRDQFLAAAAEAMRHILVDVARRKAALKRGGGRTRAELQDADVARDDAPDEVLDVHEALAGLAAVDPQAAELVKLRYFAGLSLAEAAASLGLSTRTAQRLWAYSRAWLRRAIGEP